MTNISVINSNSILQNSILSNYIKEVNAIKTLDRETELYLAQEFIKTGDIAIANQLIKSQLRNVIRVAFSYKNYGISMMDMITEGNLGLMHAIKKFHPEVGCRLSTYATWWIKAYITDFIIRSWSLVKIGTTKLQKRLFFNLAKIKRKLGNLSSASLNGNNLKMAADYAGLSPEEFTEMDIRITTPDLSLNQSNEDGNELGDIILNDTQNPEQLFVITTEKERKSLLLKKALSKLDEREQIIFYQRYISDPKITLHDLSERFGVSKERIRQIEERCLEKIKSYVNQ